MLTTGGGLVVSHHSSHGPGHVHGLSLSMEKLLHCAQLTGHLCLAGRHLKEFPKHCCKYQLKDTVCADLSRNKLSELPQECTDYFLLEKLVLYNNTIRAIPDSIVYLQSLQFLDLSRNQLTYLPSSLCELPLQALVLNNNRLVSLPEEIGKMQTLMELDASCNEIAHLPVQIGDLASLKSLNLRRNHLQEVPVEISYLQLTFLDLSGNRISLLPVELRFMTSVIELNLGENPLTCPPANLCSRGRIHVFKYLEIQAIKEDRKRGVLTDSEYRRSYRKTTQLNDFRFGSGFGADARRKRHTADSGYGSEQPLDRRWSQEFGHENGDISTTEEARRLILRAANCPRSPRGLNGLNPLNYQSRNGVVSMAPPPLPPPPVTTPIPPVINPAPSGGSSSSSSSGYTSMPDQLLRVAPVSSPDSSASCSPIGTEAPYPNNSGNMYDKRPIKEPAVKPPITQPTPQPVVSNVINQNLIPPPTQAGDSKMPNIPSNNLTSRNLSENENSNDQEKEERRRAAQKVFGKQGLTTVPGSLTLKVCQYPTIERRTGNSLADVKRTTSQRLPNKPPIWQYREQLRQQRQNQHQPVGRIGYGGFNGSAPLINGSQDQLSINELSHATTEKLHINNSEVNGNNEVNRFKSFDMKAMQKEAVLSYVKSKQVSPARSVASSHSEYSTSTRNYYHSTTTSNGRLSSAPPSSSTTTTSIPLPSNSSTSSASSVASSNGLKYVGKLPISQTSQKLTQPVAFAARRDAEKSATADAHINQLRMQIETRLRISLPEDLSTSLVDGVILCHIANHVKPRAVPSIHVPSPAVPKLTAAKCRRNVENFLLACRRIGVREEDMFLQGSRFDPMSVLTTIWALIELCDAENVIEEDPGTVLQDNPEPESRPDYPDIIPRESTRLFVPTSQNKSANLETFFLLAILIGTVALLYLFPPNDP